MSDRKENMEEEEKSMDEKLNQESEIEENREDSITEQSETEKLSKDLAESKEKYLRLYAEFENFRRRTAKEKIETVLNASEGLIKELLPIVDDFERAQKSIETSDDIDAIKEGIDLIFNKLNKTLLSKGLKAIESKDQAFDVELHECITQFAAGDDKKGKVIEEVEKGYFLNDKVIRYAKVVVGS
jgi:molecular chaperone GrpE